MIERAASATRSISLPLSIQKRNARKRGFDAL